MSQNVPRSLLALTLPLLLFACGREPTSVADDPYAGGQSSPWEAHGPAQPQALTPGLNTLQYETPTLARNSWGPIEKNRSNGEQQAGDGRPLTLNGKVYPQGYGVHAGSELRFSLKGTNGTKCLNFTADVGVDDEVGPKGSVVFQVFADGVKLYDSGVMTGASATKRVNVGVVGRQELRLVVTDAGNGISHDHADWADPKLECATQNPKAGSLDSSWGAGTTSGPLNTALLEPDLNVLTGDILARQPDGKRLVVTNLVGGGKFEVRRYNLDGSLDTSYGQGGRVTTDFGAARSSPSSFDDSYGASDAVLQADGRLVVVGKGLGPTQDSDFALARLNPNGSPDPSFGQGGLVFTDLVPIQYNPYPQPFSSAEEALKVALGPGGTLVVLGAYSNMFLPRVAGAMARYKADGSLDKSFAKIGMTQVIGDFGGSRSLVVEPDGSVVYDETVGRASTYIGVRVARVRADGVKFEVTQDFFLGARGPNGIRDLALQADGKIVVGGSSYNGDAGPGVYNGVLVRLNKDLSFDTGFGGSGTGQVILDTLDRGVQRVLIQPDGKIVAVGSSILRLWP